MDGPATRVADRKLRGAWYTPDDLVATVVAAVVTEPFLGSVPSSRPVRIVDPACGDGRFLRAAAERVAALGRHVHAVGVDIDAGAAAAARSSLRALGDLLTFEIVEADALHHEWEEPFDLVIGNPPFLSQMAAATTRGGSSRRGGGPYADAAVEFLALASELVDPGTARRAGGRVAFVLPQSVLSARDAADVRATYDRDASLLWSWWNGERVFDAQVLTCALAFEFGGPGSARAEGAPSPRPGPAWSRVITNRSGIPEVPRLMAEQRSGRLGDRVRLNANFRDEYYGMIPAVGDTPAGTEPPGPRLVTSGLIDPGRSLWGERSIRFAKRSIERPWIDVDLLQGKMHRWAVDRLVPKVLIANQTKIIEAVADPAGTMLPGVPVVAAYPIDPAGPVGPAGAFGPVGPVGPAGPVDPVGVVWEVAAVLTSPIASVWAWHRSAGTGLSADAIRLGPVMLADLPWPAGPLGTAVGHLRNGDVRRCAAAVHAAYGIVADSEWQTEVTAWWTAVLERIEARQPVAVRPNVT